MAEAMGGKAGTSGETAHSGQATAAAEGTTPGDATRVMRPGAATGVTIEPVHPASQGQSAAPGDATGVMSPGPATGVEEQPVVATTEPSMETGTSRAPATVGGGGTGLGFRLRGPDMPAAERSALARECGEKVLSLMRGEDIRAVFPLGSFPAEPDLRGRLDVMPWPTPRPDAAAPGQGAALPASRVGGPHSMGEWQALAQATPSMATAVATMTHGGRRSQPVTTEPRHATFSTLRYLRRSQQDAATTRLPKANQPPVTEYGTTMTVPTTEWRPPGGRGDGLFKAGNPGKWGRYVHPGDSLTAIEKIERFSSQSRLFEQALLRGKPEQSRPPKEQVI